MKERKKNSELRTTFDCAGRGREKDQETLSKSSRLGFEENIKKHKKAKKNKEGKNVEFLEGFCGFRRHLNEKMTEKKVEK